MKIGIYGDSFACSHKESTQIAWFNLLPNIIPNSNMICYGMGATSVYYSYKMFLETYTNFDQIIFLVTEPNRYTKLVELANTRQYFANISHVETLREKYNLRGVDDEILENLKGWFICADDEYNLDMTELMLQNMEKLHDNILFYPCFSNALKPERLTKLGLEQNQSAIDILYRQSQLLARPNYDCAYENVYKISCHFTEEFNMFFAELLAAKIMNNVWNFDRLNDVQLLHDTSYYMVQTEKTNE